MVKMLAFAREQRLQFGDGELAAGRIELRGALKQLLDALKAGFAAQPFDPALQLQRFQIDAFVHGVGAEFLAAELRLDQIGAGRRFGGDARHLQPRIVQKLAAQAEGILAPGFHLRQPLAHTIALDRVIVDEQEAVEREAELFGDRANVLGFVAPIDAESDEIIEGEQPLARIVIGIFPELADRRLVVLADAGQHDAATLQAEKGLMQAEEQADVGRGAADFRIPGEGAAGFGQHAGPQHAVEIDDDAFLAIEAEHGRERIDVAARDAGFAPIGIGADPDRKSVV